MPPNANNMPSHEDKEGLRQDLLEALLARGTRFGTSAAVISRHVKQLFDRETTEAECEAELEYLADTRRGLVEEVAKMLSTENRVWRITRAGRAFLDEGSR